MNLPDPPAAALAHSAELDRSIQAALEAAGGWLPFDDWMSRALYTPGLGYYAGAARPFGAEGDFITAPELSPFFAACIARQIAEWFTHCAPVVVEFGAGTGRLAADLLAALDRAGTPPQRYAIVEVSGALRARQRETLRNRVPALLDRIEWLDRLPDEIDGVVLANEVLDALPVQVFECVRGGLVEWGVACDAGGVMQWSARPATPALHSAVTEALAAAGLSPADWHGADSRYRSEIGLQAGAWVQTVGRTLRRGAMLLIDYGFPAREYYHPQRDTGTLMAHYRHRAHADVLRWPGLQDITAHVDFSSVARAAQAVGLDLLGYTSQARFLLNTGLLDALAEAAPDGACDPASIRMLGAAQILLSDAEMGELFKVIALGRGLPASALGFLRGDRGAAL